MSTPLLIAVGIVAGLTTGIAAGWDVRPLAAWCRLCGGSLRCRNCGYQPALLSTSPNPTTCPSGTSTPARVTTDMGAAAGPAAGTSAAAAGEAYWPRPSTSSGLLRSEVLPLADDLFLIMLDDVPGRLRVRPQIAGYALAGALLIELWYASRVALDGERLWVLDTQSPEDPLRQNLTGAVNGPGSLVVTARHGLPVPAAGIAAAEILACELLRAMTGISEVDLWIAAVNPHRLTGPSRVYSPDLPAFDVAEASP